MTLIEDKIEKLKETVMIQNLSLQDKNVIIVLPTIDENMSSICREYDIKKKDADILAHYLINYMGVDLVSVVTGRDKISGLVSSLIEPYHFLLFSHEAGELELQYYLH